MSTIGTAMSRCDADSRFLKLLHSVQVLLGKLGSLVPATHYELIKNCARPDALKNPTKPNCHPSFFSCREAAPACNTLFCRRSMRRLSLKKRNSDHSVTTVNLRTCSRLDHLPAITLPPLPPLLADPSLLLLLPVAASSRRRVADSSWTKPAPRDGDFHNRYSVQKRRATFRGYSLTVLS